MVEFLPSLVKRNVQYDLPAPTLTVLFYIAFVLFFILKYISKQVQVLFTGNSPNSICNSLTFCIIILPL